MSEHTKGKLKTSYTHLRHVLTENGFVLAVCSADQGLTATQANARRLVACWNALEDLPQEALDGGWTRAGLEAYGLRMKAQRDELLAALKAEVEIFAAEGKRPLTQTMAAIANAEAAR